MQGILLINKPKTWTSFDVVNYVRKIVAAAQAKKPKHVKVGHTGTLDPLATGLLILLIGPVYTRKAVDLSKVDKTYEVTMTLGQTSTTGDGEGEKLAVSDAIPTPEAVTEALGVFRGPLMQVPPAYSAVKVNGQRAYDLARQGKPVELEARPVTIYSSEVTSYDYPLVHFTCKVSSGTYIRTLVEDIGKHLKTGAYMSDLRRTTVGDFDIADALEVESLNEAVITAGLRES